MRIRDYTNLIPACLTLLLFAQEDSFNIDAVLERLRAKEYLKIKKFNAGHGFMDYFSQCFDAKASGFAEELVFNFLTNNVK